MTDLNYEQKKQHFWQKAHDAVCVRDFAGLRRAYWGLQHLADDLAKVEGKELPVIQA